MYRFSYAEVLEETPQSARARERMALEHAITLLQSAAKQGNQSAEAIEALHFCSNLWVLLIEDLAHPENQLPVQLRANIISIGLWIMRETEEIRQGRSENFEGIIEVSRSLAEGLS
jgi:flagellar biosynthesis activator protein FlaF